MTASSTAWPSATCRCRVFHFDCFWMREFHWSDFVWDQATFPDPEGMLRRLAGTRPEDLRLDQPLHRPALATSSTKAWSAGTWSSARTASVWQWDMWQAGMGLVDFTNPDARRSGTQDKLRALLDKGVDCFKTDFGERIPTDVV